MSRIIFVGMHNKGHLSPLCSSTKSGKMINRIVEALRFHGIEDGVLRTNLFDLPDFDSVREADPYQNGMDYIVRHEVLGDDICVLLGSFVHKNFPTKWVSADVIKVAHPSSPWSHKAKDEYVEKVVGLILSKKQ